MATIDVIVGLALAVLVIFLMVAIFHNTAQNSVSIIDNCELRNGHCIDMPTCPDSMISTSWTCAQNGWSCCVGNYPGDEEAYGQTLEAKQIIWFMVKGTEHELEITAVSPEQVAFKLDGKPQTLSWDAQHQAVQSYDLDCSPDTRCTSEAAMPDITLALTLVDENRVRVDIQNLRFNDGTISLKSISKPAKTAYQAGGPVITDLVWDKEYEATFTATGVIGSCVGLIWDDDAARIIQTEDGKLVRKTFSDCTKADQTFSFSLSENQIQGHPELQIIGIDPSCEVDPDKVTVCSQDRNNWRAILAVPLIYQTASQRGVVQFTCQDANGATVPCPSLYIQEHTGQGEPCSDASSFLSEDQLATVGFELRGRNERLITFQTDIEKIAGSAPYGLCALVYEAPPSQEVRQVSLDKTALQAIIAGGDNLQTITLGG